jgi:hypothetical protein
MSTDQTPVCTLQAGVLLCVEPRAALNKRIALHSSGKSGFGNVALTMNVVW